MLETLNDPQMLHSATVHFPVALSLLGVPLLLLAIAMPARQYGFRLVAALAYLALVGSAYVAVETGEDARSEVPPTIRTEASNLLEDHEEFAEMLWIPAAITAGFLLISLINVKWIRLPYVYRTLLAFALIGSLTCAGLSYFIGHAGGMLVYKHGIGVPLPETEFATTDANEPGDESEAMEEFAGEEEPEVRVAIRPIDMEEAKAVSFKRDVWPIIQETCIECHGEDEWEMDSEYDMRTVESMMIAGEKELPIPPVTPGKPDESSMVKYITGEYKPTMPKKRDPLSEDQVHTIRMWIAAGAIDDTKAAAQEPEPEPQPEVPPADVEPEMPADPAPEEMPAPAEDTAPEETPAPEPAPAETTEEAPTPEAPPAESPEEMPEEMPAETPPAPENTEDTSIPNDVDPDKKALEETMKPVPVPTEPPQPTPQIADPKSPTIAAPRKKLRRIVPMPAPDGSHVV